MEYGCIGEHLAHSFSKEIHNKIASYNYEICEVAVDDLEAFMINHDFKAINVTIPYKEAVIPYLHVIDDAAKEIGAVNTIVNKDGKLYGYNTDFMGMSALADRIGIEFSGKKVLVLGTGGTGKTAVAVAKSKGAREVITVSRRIGVTYEDAKRDHADAQIIINTTPCGMYPDNYSSPIELDDYPCVVAVLDAVYNPLVTKLVAQARKKGIKAECGLYMLVAQAVFASEKFTENQYDRKVIDDVFREIFLSKQNIVLTGMPGSGKSTVGKLLSEITGREFIDTDEMIVEKYGVIPAIFEAEGEMAFRDKETEAIKEAAKRCGSVIATGGGAILRSENIEALKSSGKIFFLDRPIEQLIPTDDRPLARDAEAIKKRYEERYDLYNQTADVAIKVSGSQNSVANNIMEEMV